MSRDRSGDRATSRRDSRERERAGRRRGRGRSERTRREYLTYRGALVGGGLLAGCLGAGESEPTEAGTEATSPETSTESTETATGPVTATPSSTRSVTMEPVGTVEFDQVPETWFPYTADYADMGVALGQAEGLLAIGVRARFATHYYEELPTVDVDREELTQLWQDGTGKEIFYELDADLHVVDPNFVINRLQWSRSDVDEVEANVAPFFGNTIFTRAYDWHDYPYYSMYEAFEKLAAVFGERERYEALAEVHADLVSTIQASLPSEEERPTVVRATLAADGSGFYSYHLNEPGYWLADTRPLGAVDAFDDREWGGLWGTVDYETMLEADPDVFLHLWGLTPSYSMAETRQALRSHEVGSELTAVKNDRVYPAGVRYQGPIMNLFQLEMGAKQLYPDRFGEWPRYEDGEHYPDIPADERLFDRERVASVVTGEF